MQYRLRTLLILLAVGPPILALAWWIAILTTKPIVDPWMCSAVLCLATGYPVAITLFMTAFTVSPEQRRARKLLFAGAGLAALAPVLVYFFL